MSDHGPRVPGIIDTVMFNGKVVTVDANFSVAEAVAVSGDRLAAVGTNAAILALAGERTRRIDLGGRTVVPGLIDAHPHMDHTPPPGSSLADCASIADIQARVAERVARAKPGQWIIFNKLADPEPKAPNNLKEGRFPNRHDLDAVSPDNPVWIRGSYITPSVVNSLALRLGGITRDTPQPERLVPVRDGRTGDTIPSTGGLIHKDPATGEPTGLLHDFDTLLARPTTGPLWRLVARPSHADRVAAIERAVREMSAHGLTAGYEGHGLADPVEQVSRIFLDMQTRGTLTVRTWALANVYTDGTLDDISRRMDAMYFAAHRGAGDDLLRFQGVTITLDGPGGAWDSVQPKVAEWPTPHDEIRDGVARVPVEKFRHVAREAARRGMRMATKAGGEVMVDRLIDVWGGVDAEFGIRDKRWVMMHCQFTHPRQMPRLRELGVTPTTCATFLWNHGTSFLRAYGEEVADRAVPLRSFLDAGIPITSGSDSVPKSPFVSLWLCVTRTDGETGRRMGERERVSREEALKIYTVNGAYLLEMEDRLGSLEPGKYADLVVLSDDYLTCPEANIRDISALLTMVGGRVVHAAPPF